MVTTKPAGVPTDDQTDRDADEAEASHDVIPEEPGSGHWALASSALGDALGAAMTSDPEIRAELKDRCTRLLEMIYSIEAPGRTTVVSLHGHHSDAEFIGRVVYIGHAPNRGAWKGKLEKSDFASPFHNDKTLTPEQKVEKYREYIQSRPDLLERIPEAPRGGELGCWCAPGPCHGDVLVELADKS